MALFMLLLPTFGIAAIGVVGFLVGSYAMIKDKERSILTVIPILVGLPLILWTAGELLFRIEPNR